MNLKTKWITILTGLTCFICNTFATAPMLISIREEHHTSSSVLHLGPGPINITVTCKQEPNSGRTCMDFYCDLESFLTKNEYSAFKNLWPAPKFGHFWTFSE